MSTTARLFIVASLRDKLTLFWAVLFPLALMTGLGIAFPQTGYRTQLLVGVLAMSAFFATFWTVAFESWALRHQGVYKLLKLTPFGTARFILSLSSAKSLAALLSSLVILVLGVLMWGVDLSPLNLGLLLPTLLIGILSFLLLGFLVGNFARDIAQVSLLLNLVGMPLLFLSEAFYSLERAPSWLRFISQLLPFEHFVQALQSASASNLPATLTHTLVVAGFGALFLVATLLTWRWD